MDFRFPKFSRSKLNPRKLASFVISLLVLVIVSGLGFKLLSNPVHAAWFDDNWAFRKKMTIGNTGSAVAAARKVKIDIDTATLEDNGQVQADCDDVRFTDVNGKVLRFYIDTDVAGCDNASTDFYVELPVVNAGNTDFYFYYGNPAASTGASPFMFDPMAEDMVGYWKLEESSGTREDLVHENDLTDNNTVTSATGKVGTAGQFTSANSESLSKTDNADLSTGDIDFTLAAWVYLDSEPASVTNILTKRTDDTTREFALVWNNVTETFVINLLNSSGTNVCSKSFTATTTSTATWYFVTAWHDASANTCSIQVNNSAAQSVAESGVSSDTSAPFLVGFNGTAGTYFDGRIDAVGFWKRVVTAGERARLYNSGEGFQFDAPDTFAPTSGPTAASEEKGTGPILLIRMDEGYGTTANDSTLNNLDGSMSGAAWKTEDQCASVKCIWFDGSDDVVTVTNANPIDFDTGLAGGMTFSAWVRVNSDGESDVGQIYNKGTNTYLRVTNEGSDGLADLEAKLDLGTTDATKTVVNGITLNRWHYVVVGYTDDGDDEITVYIDGLTQGSSSDGSGAPATGDTNNLLLGGPTTANYHGYIDDFKVYNYERTAAQVKTGLAAGKSGQSSVEGVAAAMGGNRDQVNQFLSNGLVGYWKLDETSGDATDSSGNGTTLTDTNTVAFSAGKFLNGGDFEVDNSEYQYAADNAALSITGNLTVVAWIKPESSHCGNIAAKWDGVNESYRLMVCSGDELRMGIDASANYKESSSANFATGTWYHVAGVYNANTQTVNLYVNGVEVAGSVTGTIPSSIGDDGGRFQLGAEDSTSTAANFFDGMMDDVRIYNRALSKFEVQSLSDWAPGPVGYWKLDENTGTTANDSSTNANTGTLTLGPTWQPGKMGQAVNFDGSDDYVTAGNGASVQITGAITLSAWVKTELASTAQSIISKHGTDTNRAYRLYINSGNKVGMDISSDGTENAAPAYLAVLGATNLSVNTWYHLTGVYIPGTSITVYINGVTDGTNSTNIPTAIFNGSAALQLGARNASTNMFDGSIDDARVYNYARSAKQIVEDMNAGHPAGGSPISSAIIHWKLDEGNGTIANNSGYDASLDGTANSVLWQSPSALVNTCKVNGCARFDTTTDFVSAGDTAFTDSLTQMTLSLWLTPTALSITDDIVGKSDFSNQNSFHVITDSTNADEIRVYIASTTSDVSNYFLTSNLDLTDNTQQHLAIVYDGGQAASNRVKVFKNGVPIAGSVVGTIPTSLTSGTTSNLKIGDTDVTGLQLTRGYYDEFKIYTSALTASEIGVDMTAGSSAAMGGVLGTQNNEGYGAVIGTGFWNMDQNTGTISIPDTSGSDFTMTMNNFEESDWVVGKYGSALDFDGSAEYLNNANDIMLHSNYTITAWVKPDNTNTGTIYMQGTTSADFPYIEITYESGAINLKSANDAGTVQNAAAASTGTLTVGQWNFIAVAKGSTTLNYMVNGITNSTTIANAGTYANMTHTSIGALHRSTDTQFFDGAIDQVKNYQINLATPFLWYLYNRGAPLIWYKLDECAGTTANNSAPPASGGDAGFDGTLTIGASGSNTTPGTCSSGTSTEAWNNGTTGKYNFSLDFDGTDDYVEHADDNQLDFNDASFSIEAWINRDSFTTDDTVWAKKTNQTTAAGYLLYIDDLTDDVNFVSADGVDSYLVNGKTAITATGWIHIVAVMDEIVGFTATIYVNGIEDKESTTGTFNSVGNMSNSSVLRLGEESDGGEPFDGRIDNFKLYRYLLPAASIKKLYNEGMAQRFGPVEGAP